MTVVGFNYTKIMAEKLKPIKGKVNISNNVTVTTVEETTLNLEKGKKAIRVGFDFTSTYEPQVANILIQGNLIYLQDEKKIAEWMKTWKKNKNLPREAMTVIINNILSKCNIQALVMSRDLNLPSPIPLPKVSDDGPLPSESKKKK